MDDGRTRIDAPILGSHVGGFGSDLDSAVALRELVLSA
jgi:hypothetical protein